MSCAAKGYQVGRIVKEIASGVNDSRRKFLALLSDPKTSAIVVEHKDRATRFGFRYLETLLKAQGRAIEVVNQAENGTEDLLVDLTAIVYAFCARLYGQRRAKRKTEIVVRVLEATRDTEGAGDADATIQASQEVFEKIVAGEQNPTAAYMTGKLKIKGDMGAAMKLQKLF